MAMSQLKARFAGAVAVVPEVWDAVTEGRAVPPPQAAHRTSVAVAPSSALDIPVSIARATVVVRVGIAGVGALGNA